MKLFIQDRVLLLNCLPEEGTFLDIAIRKDIAKKIGITQKDIEKYQIKLKPSKETGKTVMSLKEEKQGKNVEFSEPESNYMKKNLDKLDAEGRATEAIYDLYQILFK